MWEGGHTRDSVSSIAYSGYLDSRAPNTRAFGIEERSNHHVPPILKNYIFPTADKSASLGLGFSRGALKSGYPLYLLLGPMYINHTRWRSGVKLSVSQSVKAACQSISNRLRRRLVPHPSGRKTSPSAWKPLTSA